MTMTWEDAFDAMVMEQALWVRHMRVNEGRTWRWIAEECAASWAGDWECDQDVGRQICARAATILGEDPREAPWN